MAKWWYWVIHRCPTCNATWDEYDSRGGGYDSGFNHSPTVLEECEECWDARVEADKIAHPEEYL
jgi:hypothetical protein